MTEYGGTGEDKIRFITGDNSGTKHWNRKSSGWDKLVAFMAEPRFVKECGGYCPVDIKKSESQCVSRESEDQERRPHVGYHRTQAAITECSLITLDADSAEENFAKLIRECGYAGLTHSTFSHNPDEGIYKYRALIRTDRSMSAEEKRSVTRQLMRELGWGQFDTTCASPEHFMYWPSVHPEREHVMVFEELAGDLLDVDIYVMKDDIEITKHGALGSPVRAVTDAGVPATAYEVYEAHRRLDEAVRDVSGQGEGNRNNVLMMQMSKVWPLVLGGCLDEDKMIEAMWSAADACGIGEEEFEYVSSRRRDAASPSRPDVTVLLDDRGNPYPEPFTPLDEEVGPGGATPEAECYWDDCTLSPLPGGRLCQDHQRDRDADKGRVKEKQAIDAEESLYDGNNIASDLDLGYRLAYDYLEKDVRAWGKSGWAIWDGQKWDLDGTGDRVNRMIYDSVKRLFKIESRKALDASNGDHADYLKRMQVVNRLLKVKTVNDITKVVRAHLRISVARFDGSHVRHLLNCPNGVVDLRTGELSPHRRDLYFTKMTAASYLPGVYHEDWEQALRALPDDVVKYMQKRFGQACTGMPSADDVIPFLKGGGANGKSTHVDSIEAALGGFFGHVPKDIIIEGRKHDSLLMELRGVRFAVIEELPRNKWLDSTALKDVAGTGVLKSRPLFEAYVYWKPTHCLFVTSNYETQVVETDWGTWRRLERIEYRYTFDGSDPDRPGDPGLRKRLEDGASGQHEAVLSWLVEGAKRFYAEGLERGDQPEIVTQDTLTWRSQGNPVVRFSEEMLTYNPEHASLSSDVFAVYKEWSAEKNLRAGADQTFWSRMHDTTIMRQPGVEKKKSPTTTKSWAIESPKDVKVNERLVTGVRINWDHTSFVDMVTIEEGSDVGSESAREAFGDGS